MAKRPSDSVRLRTPDLAKIHENFAEWSSLPEQIRDEFLQVKKQEVLCGFSAFPLGLLEAWHRKHYRMDYELIRACAHALGNDITFEKVGSFPATACYRCWSPGL